jgi:uncharacterized membrane protein (UPF0127 family)
VKFPLSIKYARLFALATAASIALLVGCSSDDATQVEQETVESPQAVVFIDSDDCNDLQHGRLEIMEIALVIGEIDVLVQAEVANETSERAQGLMCRESIPAGTGMYFSYTESRATGFWMYNTYVPIDILYIDQSGAVVDKITMTPCLRDGLGDDEWRVKCASESAQYVPSVEWLRSLELPAGWLDTQGISDADIGDLNVALLAASS